MRVSSSGNLDKLARGVTKTAKDLSQRPKCLPGQKLACMSKFLSSSRAFSPCHASSILPSSMVTFPRKKYFPWPLESATPKLCGETEQTLRSRYPLQWTCGLTFFFLIFHFRISISCSVNNFSNSLLSKPY